MNRKKLLSVLISSSVVLLAGIFSMSYKLMGLGFLQFVLILIYCTLKVWPDVIAQMMSFASDEKFKENRDNKKWFSAVMSVAAIPFAVYGAFVVISYIIIFLFIL